MKSRGCLLLLAICSFTACKPAAKAPATKEFEYKTFEWRERFRDPEKPSLIWMTTLYRTGPNLVTTGKVPSETTNHCDTIDEVLNLIGADGWEVVSVSGKVYTVKREKNYANGFHVNIEDVSKIKDP